MLNTLQTDSCKEIAIDLEHHSYRSFHGLLCLMQLRCVLDSVYYCILLCAFCRIMLLHFLRYNCVYVTVYMCSV